MREVSIAQSKAAGRNRFLKVGLAAGAYLAFGPALAHEAGRTSDGWLLGGAHGDVMLPLAVLLLLYVTGTVRLMARGASLPLWRSLAFLCGWLVLTLTMVSPLHAVGAGLFTAHMIEHELMVVAAAPLMAVGRPLAALLWGCPHAVRRRLGRAWASPALRPVRRSGPLPAACAHAVAIWVWHAPVLYQAALTSVAVHWLQHVLFFGTALWMWSAVVRARDDTQAVLAVFGTMLQTGLLGVLFLVAGRPLYPLQSLAAPTWGLTPLEDQQLAGVVMWVPGGLVYALAAIIIAARWLAVTGPVARGVRE